MLHVEDPWAPLADRFADEHYASLRGRVRTHVLHQQLMDHLPPPPAKVVDVGGGAGHQSLPLAQLGYEITIVEPSVAMRAKADHLLSAQDAEVRRRVRILPWTGEQAAERLGGFDAVLCHGVVMYVDPVEPLLAALSALARAAGIVSVVAKSPVSLVSMPALQGRWHEALAGFHGSRQRNGLGVDTRADSVTLLETMLLRHGVEPLAWYGVRLFTDGWRRDDGSVPDEEAVLAVELEASRREPYRSMSRLFHWVGRRSA